VAVVVTALLLQVVALAVAVQERLGLLVGLAALVFLGKVMQVEVVVQAVVAAVALEELEHQMAQHLTVVQGLLLA
jgi:hypothetical protein